MNHYNYLERALPQFFANCDVRGGWHYHGGIIIAHGDKGYGYKDKWEEAEISFPRAMAVYLLSYCYPYNKESRETENGWVDPAGWVVDNYSRFDHLLPKILDEDKC